MPEPTSPPTSPKYVPYQAYKPKRHSRNFSNNSVVGSRPPSTVVSPVASPLPRLHPEEDKDPVPSLSLVGSYGASSSSSPLSAGRYMELHSSQRLGTPAIRVEPVETQPEVPESAQSLPGDKQTSPAPPEEQSRPTSASAAVFPTSSSPSSTSTMPPSPSSPSMPGTSTSGQLSPAPRKISTFRRLTPRPSAPSSPLAPPNRQMPSVHARNVSTASLPTPSIPKPIEQQHSVPPIPVQSNTHSRPSSILSAPALSPRHAEKELPHIPRAMETRSAEGSRPNSSQASSLKKSISHGQNGAASLGESTPSSFQKSMSTPYRPGFQPKGVYRPLTDEFLALRRSKRNGEDDVGRMKRIEKTKLERRFEKLVNLHFPVPGSQEEKTSASKPDPRTINRRASSFFDFESLKNRKLSDAGDLWRGVVTGGQDKLREIRGAEQRITPWEEDSAVTKCPLCQASFHPLTNRKHHCRLCGRIICSLPPKHPQRPVTCSLLFVVDSKTRQIEEVGEGVDYGVRRKKNNSRQEDEDKFLRGVRICRDCRPVLAREQYLRQSEESPAFARLYNLLLTLENEIEESLPQFQELLMTLNHNDQPTKEAMAARRRLLDAFAQYDKLSKQIHALPCPGGPGSSQDRVQMAISSRANLFLQKNMFPLQFLPKPSAKNVEQNGTPTASNVNDMIDQDSELAQRLQPLLEQETLLESFIEEAKAQRKFEDVKTLKQNYAEIRREIDSVLGGTGIPAR